jgi:hypothetical protein
MWDQAFLLRGRRDRMVVEFTITYALNAESLSVLSEKMRSYKCFPYASKMPNLTSNRASSVIIKNAMIFLTQKQGMWEGIQPVHRSGTRRARKFTWTFEFCMKVYQWFYWTSNPQFWEKSQRDPLVPKHSCPPCKISLGSTAL